jgi:3-methylcrotonyl-CoA carboxylase alpha subunit
MGKAAVDAARAVGYVGAGTVEFIASDTFVRDGSFYFMEMNTRLQVEHPVTEMISGQDLVEWQLRVASGEPLPLRQEQLEIRGHALEARIYAENPEQDFLPSTGRLVHLSPPAESLNVRVDTGIEQGDEISPYYDPMIAKLVVWDVDRDAALARMWQALADYRIVGVSTNVTFLSRLVVCPAFADADLDTGLIERSREFLFPARSEPPRNVFFVAAVAGLLREQAAALNRASHSGDPWSPWSSHDGWRLNIQSQRTLTYRSGDSVYEVAVAYEVDGWRLALAGESVLARGRVLESGRFAGQLAVELDDRRLVASVVAVNEKQEQKRHVFLNGTTTSFCATIPCTWLKPAEHTAWRPDGTDAGQGGRLAGGGRASRWKRCAALLILEAMKMEHTITAPKNGIVKAFCYAAGDQVADGAELVDFAAEK